MMNAFFASENLLAFIGFRFSPSNANVAENTHFRWSSLRGSGHFIAVVSDVTRGRWHLSRLCSRGAHFAISFDWPCRDKDAAVGDHDALVSNVLSNLRQGIERINNKRAPSFGPYLLIGAKIS